MVAQCEKLRRERKLIWTLGAYVSPLPPSQAPQQSIQLNISVL